MLCTYVKLITNLYQNMEVLDLPQCAMCKKLCNILLRYLVQVNSPHKTVRISQFHRILMELRRCCQTQVWIFTFFNSPNSLFSIFCTSIYVLNIFPTYYHCCITTEQKYRTTYQLITLLSLAFFIEGSTSSILFWYLTQVLYSSVISKYINTAIPRLMQSLNLIIIQCHHFWSDHLNITMRGIKVSQYLFTVSMSKYLPISMLKGKSCLFPSSLCNDITQRHFVHLYEIFLVQRYIVKCSAKQCFNRFYKQTYGKPRNFVIYYSS